MIEALQFDSTENYKTISKYQFFKNYVKIGKSAITVQRKNFRKLTQTCKFQKIDVKM